MTGGPRREERVQAGHEFRMPDAAIPFVLLQRTNLQRLGRISAKLRIPYYPRVARAETRFRGKNIGNAYLRDMENEYMEMRGSLPAEAERIVDIGCGMAGLDLFLARHYATPGPPSFVLVDKSTVSDEIYYGLRQEAAFYNSLGIARETLVTNGVEADQVSSLEVEGSEESRARIAQLPSDLVVSLYAWGFHFPVSTYVREVGAGLRPRGAAILDVRREHADSIAELEEFIGPVEIVVEDSKRIRVAAVKEAGAN